MTDNRLHTEILIVPALLMTNALIRCSYLQPAWQWRDMARYVAAIEERRERTGTQLP